MSRCMEQVPAPPFRELLEQRMAHYEAQLAAMGPVSNEAQLGMGTAIRVAEECGWGSTDAGVRRLFRLRHQRKAGSRKGRKGEFPTSTYPRETVEEALHHAGVDFTDLYVEYAARIEGQRASARDVLSFIRVWEPLAEELVGPVVVRHAWCIRCAEDVLLDAEGNCQWCAGEREFKEQLAKRALQQGGYRARRAAKEAA